MNTKTQLSNPLEKIFSRHYDDGPAALDQFRINLKKANLSFDVEAQIDEQEFPPQGEFIHGVPSFISYHIPGTGFGSITKAPTTPSPATHNRTADGVGLNMGCPIRLAHALDAVFMLKPQDQTEPLAMLGARPSHLHAVEELLWLTLWKGQREISRGGQLVRRDDGQKPKDVDWFFISGDTPIYLETKFRPTDWMRAMDKVSNTTTEKLFEDIGSKFPKEKPAVQKCIAGITGFGPADDDFFRRCEQKLVSNDGLCAILYRSLLGPVVVCSLDGRIVTELASLISFPKDGEYPFAYPIIYNRQFQKIRRTAVSQTSKQWAEKGLVFFSVIPTNQLDAYFETKTPYRYEIPKWGVKGKPELDYVPYLPQTSMDLEKDSANVREP